VGAAGKSRIDSSENVVTCGYGLREVGAEGKSMDKVSSEKAGGVLEGSGVL